MPLKSGYSRATINANIASLIREGRPEPQAVAIALDIGRKEYFKKHPKGFPPFHLRTRAEKARTMPASRRNPASRQNPASRVAIKEAAASLARRFMGREPDSEFVYQKPKIPDAMASPGKIFAVEYIAERDGKQYRFRHVFKAKARPHLAVSPDGSLAVMIGGSWRFTEDGFEDEA